MEITKTSDKKDRYLNILIFGFPGVGKTVFTGTAPNPLILDIEGGTLSLSGQDLMKVDVSDYKEVEYVLRSLQTPENIKKMGFDYVPKTIVIDSGTELQSLIVNQVAQSYERNVPQLKDWNEIHAVFKNLITGFRDLPFNFIVTALAEETKDEESGMILRRPMFAGKKIATEVSGYMDLVLYLGMHKGKDGEPDKRVCLTQSTERVYAKVRHDPAIEIPKYIEPDFAKIYNAIYKKESKK